MPIALDALIVLVVVGLVAGWLAGLITQGGGFGVIGNIIVGIIGAFIGQYLFAFFGIVIAPGIIDLIIAATVGAVILLFIIGLLRR